MKCKVCGKLNHHKDTKTELVIESGIYIRKPPQYYCIICAALISGAYLKLVEAGGVVCGEIDPNLLEEL